MGWCLKRHIKTLSGALLWNLKDPIISSTSRSNHKTKKNESKKERNSLNNI
jgi:hypothetical protein